MDDPARAAGGTLGDYASQQGMYERPMTDVLRNIVGNVNEMMRSEVRLVRAELREETRKTARATAWLAAGGVAAITAGVFLLVVVAQLLNLVLPDWVATLIIAACVGIAAAIMISKGRAGLHVPIPDRTIENVKENVEWMKNRTK